MSLGQSDIVQVRDVVVKAIETLVIPRLSEHDRRLERLKQEMAEAREDIRAIRRDIAAVKVDTHHTRTTLHRLDGRLVALDANIKEVDRMQRRAIGPPPHSIAFAQLPLEQKLVQMNTQLLRVAREAGISLSQ